MDAAKVRAYIYSYTNNRTLKASSKYLLSSAVQGNGNGKTTIKYKVVPQKTGVMTVTLKDYGLTSTSGYVTLLSKGKKAVSEKLLYSSDSDSYKVRFGVKKGTTYYIKVSDTYGSSSEAYKYGIKYSIKAATDRAISKKSKAKNLKRKASATSTLFTATGKKETDWYKIKVTAKRETKIKIDATQIRYGSDSKLTITCYKGSKKIGDSTTLYPGNSVMLTIYYGDYSKATKGTYYIKVVKSAKLSGKYSIKYVK